MQASVHAGCVGLGDRRSRLRQGPKTRAAPFSGTSCSKLLRVLIYNLGFRKPAENRERGVRRLRTTIIARFVLVRMNQRIALGMSVFESSVAVSPSRLPRVSLAGLAAAQLAV